MPQPDYDTLYDEVMERINDYEMMLEKTEENKYPDDNPKTSIGASKVPLHLVPPAVAHHAAMAFEDGARKYGAYNWRDKTVSTSVYIGAAKRHLDAFWDGQDESSDAHVHHLGHVIACCGIILDAMAIGKLNDDRPTAGAAGALQEEYNNKKKEVNEQSVLRVPTQES